MILQVYKTRTKVVSSQPIFNAGTERFVRDWRSCVVTVTVRDSRHRQHDPIIGVVPLKLSDILQTGSEVTRWYPLDGGIGFGRVRLSLLFRSVDLKLPLTQLGWDIGTFEFTSTTISSANYGSGKTRLRLRTGGSSANIKKEACTKAASGQGLSWDISGENGHDKVRLPVRYRYRSPVFVEFYPSGKRHADAFAALWLQELVDLEEKDFDIPIWKCNNGLRLSQNYITEENFKDIPDIKIEEIGRLKFKGRFSSGTDRDHVKFISDNNSRETIETWEACFAEGVREEEVRIEIPPTIERLHDESLTHGRDVLAQADPHEKEQWLAKDGTDWSLAFGKNPAELMNKPENMDTNGEEYDDFDEEDDTSGDVDLGINDAETEPRRASVEEGRPSVDSQDSKNSETPSNASNNSNSPLKAYKDYKERSRDLHRKHRGLMQWRPLRNVQFAKNEAVFAVRRMSKLGKLDGRKPDVETEV
jgi:hypothetical protein